jgi:hypothetical protein
LEEGYRLAFVGHPFLKNAPDGKAGGGEVREGGTV